MAKHLFLTERRTIDVGRHTIRLLILRPLEARKEKVPGVLWVHGGGYQSGSAKDIFATRALSLVVKFGAVLVAPNYRLSKKHPYPAALHDCYAALLYLKEHADELGVRSDQIMVGGESAGGGMAAALCMLAHDRGEVNIAFQMPLYPMLDDRDTPSSADNHAPNWNTRRNHKAWKRYLREAYGTDIVSSPATQRPPGGRIFAACRPAIPMSGPSSRSTARRWTMSAACGRPGSMPRSTSGPIGSTPTICFFPQRRKYARPSNALSSTINTPRRTILPRSATRRTKKTKNGPGCKTRSVFAARLPRLQKREERT